MYALNDLYRERQNEIYLKHSLFMSDAIMEKQLTEETTKKRQLIGGYKPKSNKNPGFTTNACWSEGLGAAYRLAKDFGYNKYVEKIKNVMRLGVAFQLQAQLKTESVMYFEHKNLCLGAFHKNFRNFEIRNDYTQHNISSFISLYNMLSKENE